MRTVRYLIAGWLFAGSLTGSAVFAEPVELEPSGACAGEQGDLSREHRQFLEDVGLLIGADERETFLCLREGYQRDAFIAEFWKARDPYPDTARNELERDWKARLLEVRQLFDRPDDPRSKHWLLEGPPSIRVPICPERSHTKIEAWFYGFAGRAEIYEAVATRRLRRGQHAVLFYAPWGSDRWRAWLPGDRLGDASFADASLPGPGSGDASALGAGCDRDLFQAARTIISLEIETTSEMAYTFRVVESQEKREPPSGEWLSTFRSYSTDPTPGATSLRVGMDVSYPGVRGGRTLVQLAGTIEAASASSAEALGHRAWGFEVIGEVLRRDFGDGDPVLFEPFRYRFEFPADEAPPAGELPVVIQRYLRPGPYTLVLRIDDLHGDAEWREERAVDVPSLAPEDPPLGGEVRASLEEARDALAMVEPTLEIVEPAGELLAGYLRFETEVTGPVDRVTFLLDEEEVLTKTRPPFSVDLDLGDLPRSRLLRAVAFDAQGNRIASDTQLVNGSPHRFAVRLMDPAPGTRHRGSVRARVDVTVPARRTLDRVEVYRDEELVATLYQEPFIQAIPLGEGEPLTILRAVARLEDGSTLEDTVLINGQAALDEMNVELVELYTTVTDRDGRPVRDLEGSDFRVFEDGVEQRIERFERIEDTPIRGTLLLDVSASMEERLTRVVDAAARFFRQVVRERDELSVITFHDRPRVTVPFTGRLPELGRGLVGLRAERGTALYDSLIYALHHLNGLSGQRVVLLLSDGEDEHSRFTFDETLEYARRSRAAIYAVGLDLDGGGEPSPRKVLERLASETGGRAFFLDDVEALDGIYAQIAAELRAKYLLAYQSSNAADDETFRSIEVELGRRLLEARTLRGYYP